VIIEAPVLSG